MSESFLSSEEQKAAVISYLEDAIRKTKEGEWIALSLILITHSSDNAETCDVRSVVTVSGNYDHNRYISELILAFENAVRQEAYLRALYRAETHNDKSNPN